MTRPSRYPVLRTTHGSWSGGTRVQLLTKRKNGICIVRVLVRDQPILEVPEDDLVWRRTNG